MSLCRCVCPFFLLFTLLQRCVNHEVGEVFLSPCSLCSFSPRLTKKSFTLFLTEHAAHPPLLSLVHAVLCTNPNPLSALKTTLAHHRDCLIIACTCLINATSNIFTPSVSLKVAVQSNFKCSLSSLIELLTFNHKSSANKNLDFISTDFEKELHRLNF